MTQDGPTLAGPTLAGPTLAGPTLAGPAPPGFARHFARLAGPFFAHRLAWLPRAPVGGAWLAVTLLALTLAQVAIQVRFNVWNRDFFDSLEQRDARAFLLQIGVFAALAGGSMAVSIYQVYVKQLLQLAWREWLTRRLVGRWLAGARHYLLPFLAEDADNPDQRIAEDARLATELAVEFAVGLVNAALMLATFVGILWTLSGPLSVLGWEIPGYMVWAALLYALAGSALALLMGRPLIALNVERTRAEADFRFALARVREHSEPIALVRGERDEAGGLARGFATVAGRVRLLMQGQRRLMWLTSGYAMVAMVFPTLVASPQYFSGALTLGGLMQIAAAFQQVQIALSWFVDNFPRLAEWRSAAGRVVRLNAALAGITALEADPAHPRIARTEGEGGRIVLEALSIDQADGRTVLADASASIAEGERVLITGADGTPSGMLLRAIAGLWPWGAGRIEAPPPARSLFLPQRPYLPPGTLLAAMVYPGPHGACTHQAAAAALCRVGLAHLADRLDEQQTHWERGLSLGEQQRLGFARLLFADPGWVFLDDALSGLDEDGAQAMLALLAEAHPRAGIVSVGRGAAMEAWHARRLHLVLQPGGAHLLARLVVRTAPARPRATLPELDFS